MPFKANSFIIYRRSGQLPRSVRSSFLCFFFYYNSVRFRIGAPAQFTPKAAFASSVISAPICSADAL